MENFRHLSSAEIEGYRSRKLSGRTLLAVGDHLAECPECRATVLRATSPVHLTEEQFQKYADGLLHDASPLEHLKQCERCRTDAADLRQFAHETQPRRARWRVAVAATAAIAASLMLCIPMLRHRLEPRPKPVILAQVEELPPDLKLLRSQALESGSVPIPASIRQLAGQQGTLRGFPIRHTQVTLESPVATAVPSTLPEFRWEPVEGASWYRVAVFDSNFNLVEESPHLDKTNWVPSHPLRAGPVYVWQLTISLNGTETNVPQPPAPPAKFVVLEQNEAKRLSAEVAKYPQDHILRGLLYAKAGVVTEARREWRKAVNEGHPEAARLLK